LFSKDSHSDVPGVSAVGVVTNWMEDFIGLSFAEGRILGLMGSLSPPGNGSSIMLAGRGGRIGRGCVGAGGQISRGSWTGSV
jgi:hypothetical protein